MYDLDVSRYMLHRAFIYSFSVGERKSITYQETAMFNSLRYLVPKFSWICIFSTFILFQPGNTWFCAMKKKWVSIPHSNTFLTMFWVHQLSLESEHSRVVEHYGLVSSGEVKQCKQGQNFKLDKSISLNSILKCPHFNIFKSFCVCVWFFSPNLNRKYKTARNPQSNHS